MATKRHTAEQIVRKLREAEVELARGSTVKPATFVDTPSKNSWFQVF